MKNIFTPKLIIALCLIVAAIVLSCFSFFPPEVAVALLLLGSLGIIHQTIPRDIIDYLINYIKKDKK